MEALRRRKLNPHLGVEIDCATLDLTRPLGKEGARSLFKSLMEHKVVALRNTGMRTAEQHQEFTRQVQVASLEGTNVERKEELLFEVKQASPFQGSMAAPGVVRVGPYPTKKGHAIGNAVWHSDGEYYHPPLWFTSLRGAKLPRDPETGEVLPCGDTMWADMNVAFEDLPKEEKEFYQGLRCVFDWKVAFPHIRVRADRGLEGAKERYQELTRVYPSIERPMVRRHPVTGRLALKADPAYMSHIVGKTPEETRAILERVTRLCEVPEYQLRIPWRAEDDLVIFDNYVVCHRVVTDFYDGPPEVRTLENIATKGHPAAQDVLVPEAEIDASRNPHHTEGAPAPLPKQQRGPPGSSRL